MMPSLLVYSPKTLPYSRVLVMLPGFGNSSAPFAKFVSKKAKPHSDTDATVIVTYGAMFSSFTELATLIWAALSAQGFTHNLVLIGYSMGGFVAQHLAKMYPDAVIGVVLACSGCPENGMLPLTSRGKALEIVQIILSKSVAMLFLPKDEQRMAKKVHPYEDKCMSADNNAQMHAILQYTNDSKGKTVADACGSLAQPVLLLHGDSDTVLGVNNARAMHQALPNSQLYVFENVGHGLLNEYGEAMNDLIARWIVSSTTVTPTGTSTAPTMTPMPTPGGYNVPSVCSGYSFSLVV